MKTIYVHPNEQKPNIREAVSEVCALLRSRGERVLVSAAYFDPALPGVTYCPAEEAIPQAAFAVSLGGDGTMLRLSRLAARSQVPIIGVNLGHVGFMTELERDEIPLLGRVLDGNFTCDDRMMLRLTVLRGGRAVFTCDALNDIALVRGTPMFHVVHIDVEADGTRVAAFSGDGVVKIDGLRNAKYGRLFAVRRRADCRALDRKHCPDASLCPRLPAGFLYFLRAAALIDTRTLRPQRRALCLRRRRPGLPAAARRRSRRRALPAANPAPARKRAQLLPYPATKTYREG